MGNWVRPSKGMMGWAERKRIYVFFVFEMETLPKVSAQIYWAASVNAPLIALPQGLDVLPLWTEWRRPRRAAVGTGNNRMHGRNRKRRRRQSARGGPRFPARPTYFQSVVSVPNFVPPRAGELADEHLRTAVTVDWSSNPPIPRRKGSRSRKPGSWKLSGVVQSVVVSRPNIPQTGAIGAADVNR